MRTQLTKKRAIRLNLQWIGMKWMVVSCKPKHSLKQRQSSIHPQLPSWTTLKMNGNGDASG
eukprot:12883259-Prorocentrum_lima.AAC.1